MMRGLVLLFVASTVAGADLLPLKSGATWTYRAHVEWSDDDNNVRRDTITWTSVALSIHRRGKRTAAVIEGLPLELAYYGPGQMRGYFVLIEDDDGVKVTGAESRQDAERIAREENDAELLIAKPPVIGDCDDPNGCWCVEEKVSTPRGRGWRLAFRSDPDLQFITFVPGVGITHYHYEHGGTVAVDATLTSFRR